MIELMTNACKYTTINYQTELAISQWQPSGCLCHLDLCKAWVKLLPACLMQQGGRAPNTLVSFSQKYLMNKYLVP